MSLDTPWNRARKTKSQRQEERLGKMPGGEKQNNSGRFWRWKRDGKLHHFLIECRTTETPSYSIKKGEWLDIRRQAFQTPPGLLPGMQIDIQDVSLIVIETGAFEDAMVRLMELEARVYQFESHLPEVSD